MEYEIVSSSGLGLILNVQDSKELRRGYLYFGENGVDIFMQDVKNNLRYSMVPYILHTQCSELRKNIYKTLQDMFNDASGILIEHYKNKTYI